MKKLFVLLASTLVFTACEKEIFGYKFDKTNRSLTEVMQSADYWIMLIKNYTEPGGKGEEHKFGDVQEDGTVLILGATSRVYEFTGDYVRVYAKSGHPAIPHCYYDLEMSELGDNSFTVGDSHWEIIGYDDDNILVETENFYTEERNGVSYPYAIVYFSKGHNDDPNWRDEYVPFEEYKKVIDEVLNGGYNQQQ